MTFTEIQAIRTEISTVTAIIARVEQRLSNLASHTEEEHESSQRAIAELKRENAEFANRTRWLNHQKDELERRLAQQKPDLDNAIEAREASRQKLKYTRRVVRDLVIENERVAGGLPSNLTEAEEQEEMRRALEESMAISVSSSSSSSGSARTARQHQSPLPAPSARLDSERRHPRTEASEVGSSSTTRNRREATPPTPSSASPDESVHPQSSQPVGTDDVDRYAWSIHYSHPPGSCTTSFGPVGYSRMLQHALIVQGKVAALKHLETTSDVAPRMHFIGDLAFMYDPIFLEGRSGETKKSCILDWGTEEITRSLERFVRGNRQPLHTFLFPTDKKHWFYVGAHTWKVTDFAPVWPSLGRKRKIVERLVQRSHQEFDEATITTAFDVGDLRQLCVEISSNGHLEKSIRLARKMGYEAPR
ncbi:hypothetical protein FPV67DRAFT_423263 [Lyophyllum atratum]|nr:hypothetical protein FPV67DRAFT_423263 [Lyophyllum atratum]